MFWYQDQNTFKTDASLGVGVWFRTEINRGQCVMALTVTVEEKPSQRLH